jgi:triacylglycerol lipase
MSTTLDAETALLPAAEAGPATEPLQLQLEDTLGSRNRLWLRGRLLTPIERPTNGHGRTWWRPWHRPPSLPAEPTTVQLELRIAGTSCKAEVPLDAEGRFEALLSVELPAARRGYRVARHHVCYGARTAEACGLLLTPPADAAGAVAVFLPRKYTVGAEAAHRFARLDFAQRLTPLLQSLAQASHSVYYVACVAPGEESRQAEWALAATALGWPTGQFVLLPADDDGVRSRFLTALDHLRWVFARQLDFVVLNLEPSIAEALTTAVAPAEDRAPVERLINPDDDPWKGADGNSRRTPLPHHSRPTRSNLLPRYPVVFCHGMLAFTTLKMQLPENLNCFWPMECFLRERGFTVLFPQVPATSGVIDRAERLRDQILAWTDEPVNLIAHSMGGLDCRYMITHLNMAHHVRSLTTVSTPHRGTALADWFLRNYRNRVPLLLAMEAFGINIDGFRDCRLEACRAFNETTPNQPGVRYFSFGGAVPIQRVTPFLRRAWNILTPLEGPNDGMVSLTSARWGEYLGTVHADHFAQTPDAVFLRQGEDFDALGFYTRVVENLARRGF